MLDASFVESIKSIAENAVLADVIDVGGGESVVLVGGQVVREFVRDKPLGTITVADYYSFVEAVKYLSVVDGQTIIRVKETVLIGLIEPTKPHLEAEVLMEFRETAAAKALRDWSANFRSVAQINKLLRTMLAGTFSENLLAIFRQVEFSRSGATTVTKTAHRDTMGRSVDNAVGSAAGELPEEIVFMLPLFLNVPNDAVPIRMFLEANAEAELMKLTAVGDSLDAAVSAVVRDLQIKLSKEFPDALVVAG